MSITHGLASTGEYVTLNGTGPAGFTVTFAPASPVALSGSTTGTNVTVIVSASATAPLGNSTIGIKATSGSISQSTSFSVKVVQYRVVMVHNSFVPSTLNVTAGSTVYWQNYDGPAGGCGAVGGSGIHSVVFTTLPINSSSVSQFQVFNYTFNTPGSYFYYSSVDSDHLMNGTINVVAAGAGNGGGMGMASRMPSFSYFKSGSALVQAKDTSIANRQGVGLAAGVLAFAGILVSSVGQALAAGIRPVAVPPVLSVLALGLAFTAWAIARRPDTLAGARE